MANLQSARVSAILLVHIRTDDARCVIVYGVTKGLFLASRYHTEKTTHEFTVISKIICILNTNYLFN